MLDWLERPIHKAIEEIERLAGGCERREPSCIEQQQTEGACDMSAHQQDEGA